MKRLVSLLAAVILVLSAISFAAADGVAFTTQYFTLQLPEKWIIDTENLESEEGEQCLGYFGGPENVALTAGVYLVYYEDFKNVALWSSNEEELKDYTDALMEDFRDSKPELIGIVKAGKIPLVVLKCVDADGEFIYADTMTNGYAIEFEFYVTDEDGKKSYPITEEHIEQVKNILATFQPAA
jgi:hypothetical protein